ncbi:MAG: hypothetical protein QGF59_25525 [Pirellulaceae bacterium]|nr:hypothetical protein [Pirellulaceae bacterium]
MPLEEAPWVAAELYLALKASKEAYLESLETSKDLSPADETTITLGKGVGGDPFPLGIEANRKALEALVRFTVDQHILPSPYSVEELFAEATLAIA